MSAETLTRARLNRGWKRFGVLAVGALLLAGTKLALSFERDWYVSFNWTQSLPFWAFWVDETADPRVGDYIDFWPPENPYYEGISFVKQVMAGPGDMVVCRGRTFLVEGVEIARAKTHAQNGDGLAQGPCGPVPADHYFVVAPHTDSFDSRYEVIGHVPRHAVRGVAKPLL